MGARLLHSIYLNGKNRGWRSWRGWKSWRDRGSWGNYKVRENFIVWPHKEFWLFLSIATKFIHPNSFSNDLRRHQTWGASGGSRRRSNCGVRGALEFLLGRLRGGGGSTLILQGYSPSALKSCLLTLLNLKTLRMVPFHGFILKSKAFLPVKIAIGFQNF